VCATHDAINDVEMSHLSIEGATLSSFSICGNSPL